MSKSWYVAKGSAGFTMDPEQAERDIYDIPIICPGDIARILKRHRKRGENVLDMLFEALLDAIEAIDATEAKKAEEFFGGEKAKQASLNLARGIALGLATALAAHEHTALYLNPETREQAIDLVRQRAMEAFDEPE